MSSKTIRNVVFDVGNVIVPWDPDGIVRTALGEDRVEAPGFRSPLSGNPLWLAINRGEHTLSEARNLYIEKYGLTGAEVDRLYEALLDSMVLLDGTVPLMHDLAAAGCRLFAITDNVNEIVAYLKETHDFWPLFEHASVSSELGVLKPDPRMYLHVIETGHLVAEECLFFDDVPRNVEGAETVGMVGRVFTDALTARADLKALGVAI